MTLPNGLDKYHIDTQMFEIFISDKQYLVNEYTLRNLFLASAKDEINVKIDVKCLTNDGKIEYNPLKNGLCAGTPCSEQNHHIDLSTNLKFDLLKCKVKSK